MKTTTRQRAVRTTPQDNGKNHVFLTIGKDDAKTQKMHITVTTRKRSDTKNEEK